MMASESLYGTNLVDMSLLGSRAYGACALSRASDRYSIEVNCKGLGSQPILLTITHGARYGWSRTVLRRERVRHAWGDHASASSTGAFVQREDHGVLAWG
jgi:hypothetical protein